MNYFTDAVLRAPTLGSMFIGAMAALIGVTVVLRKESLVGEALSHAAYPGVMAGVIFWGLGSLYNEGAIQIMLLTGAFITSFIAYLLIGRLERIFNIPSDSALCLILSSFFGIGVFFASIIQFQFSSLYNQAQTYIFGQSATLTDFQMSLFFILLLVIAGLISFFYRKIKIYLFDASYAETLGIKTHAIEMLLFFLTTLALVAGIRAVGVVLMSALMIAPALSARELTNHLGRMYAIAALLGALYAFGGVVLSNELSIRLSSDDRFSMPTGPTIVLVAAFITGLILLFNPKRGLVFRAIRTVHFKTQTLYENILKTCLQLDKPIDICELHDYLHTHSLRLRWSIKRLVNEGWLKEIEGRYYLTEEGRIKAKRIQRLHRLWEVYLVDYVGINKERVHKSAEEMEHLINPELEKELTKLLKDPKVDPHEKPIPGLDEV